MTNKYRFAHEQNAATTPVILACRKCCRPVEYPAGTQVTKDLYARTECGQHVKLS